MAKLTWVEMKLFLREPLTVIFTFALPLLFLFILNGVFGNEVKLSDKDTWRGVGPADYYVPVYVGLAAAAIGLIAMPVHLAGYRERSVLRRFRASSIPLWSILGSQVLVTFAMALVCVVLLAATSAALYQTQLLPSSKLPFVGAFVLGVGTFAMSGSLLGSVMPTARAAQGAGLLLFFVQELLSGAGPPRAVLTGGMYVVSDTLPLTHVVLVLQDAWLGLGRENAPILISLGVTLASVVLSARFFRWE